VAKRISKSQIVVTIAGCLTLLALVVYCSFQLTRLSTSYSIRQFFPKDHPILHANARSEQAFEIRAAPIFYAVLEIPSHEAGTWLDKTRLSQLAQLTERLGALTNVRSALSLANVEMAVNRGSELRLGTLADTMPARTWRQFIDHQPILRPQLISQDYRSALIVVESLAFTSAELITLENQIRDTMKGTESQFRSGLAGVPVVQSKLSQTLQNELRRFLFLCLAIFIAVFAAFYRNLAPVALTGVGLVTCNICVLGFLAAIGVPFTMLLATLPIIVSIAFVSLAIHTLHLWSDRLREAGAPTDLRTRWTLSIQALRELLLANLLGSMTTAIGFATLATTAIPAIRQYAWVVSMGVMSTFVLSQILFSITLVWINPVQRRWMSRRAWWTLAITRRAPVIFGSVILLSIVAGSMALKLNFSSRLFDDLPEHEAVRDEMMQIDSKFGGTVNLDIAIDGESVDAWKNPKALANLNHSLTEIRKVPGVGTALGLTDFFDHKIPRSQNAAAEALFLYSMSSENPLRHFLDSDSRITRVSLRLQDIASDRVDELREKVREILMADFPEASLSETGLAVSSHTLNREVARELVFGFWQSLVVIGVLLLFVFRSWRWALVACLPNLVAPAILIGVMAVVGTPIKPAIALIFSIALGLAFNNTVYLLTRLRKLYVDGGCRTLPLKRALLDEGNPCLSESLLTFAGFLIFLSSDFKLNRVFGVYMVLSIMAGALGDLVFLPAMLKIFPNAMGAHLKVTKRDHTVLKDRAAMVATTFMVFLACILVSLPARAMVDGDAKALLEQARKTVESQSDQATIEMKIIEANGEARTRKIRLKTMREGDSYKAIARILAPTDVKGTALLAEVKDGNESQWLYLPSSRQVRRVVSGKKSSGVLGSELSPEDLNAAALKGATAKMLSKDAQTAQIEVAPTAGASEYSKVILTLKMPQALLVQTSYFVGDKEKKRVEFKDYVSPNGKVQRASKMIVKNLENGRGTEVTFSDLVVNAAMNAGDFTVASLKKGE
jgi:predicted RND superfamily exporter protein